MIMAKRAKILGIMCCALMGASQIGRAAQGDVFEGRYLESRISDITLPDSCKSPYRDAPNFIEFFNTTLYVMAARKGSGASGIAELFGVLSLREKMRELFPNLGEESPLDRLIVAQLCLFEKVQVEKRARPGQAPLVILPTDSEVQTHLAAIAPRLYQDARTLMVEALAVRAREKKQNLNLTRQWDEIQEARAKGQEKNKELFKDL